MKKSYLFICIAISLVLILFLYWWFFMPIKENSAEIMGVSLFNRQDYQIEERSNEKYIVIDSIGFSAKIPDNWKLEWVNETDQDQNATFVNILSPDAEMNKTKKQGCGLSIMAQTNRESYIGVLDNIRIISTEPSKAELIRKNYNFNVFAIDNYPSIKWESPTKPMVGTVFGIDIPLKQFVLVNIGMRISPEAMSTCLPIWEKFLDSISIKE